MIFVFIFSCLIILFTIPFAFSISNESNSSFYIFSKKLIFGVIFISFLAITINFFYPLNVFISSLIPLISLVILIKNKEKFFNINFVKFLVISGFLLTILILESNVYRPDAGLYHLPFIGILNTEKIIFGLSNLHFRYAHTSIIQYYAAISNNFIFKDNGIVFAQGIIATAIIINFISQLHFYIKKENYNFHFYFLVYVIIYVAYKMNRYSEYGNDAPAHFLVFFLISEVLISKNKFNLDQFLNNLILSLFIIQNKLTLILIVILSLIDIKKVNLKEIIFKKKFIFLNFFFLIWIIKNLITSGCALYPLEYSCISHLSWVNINDVIEVSKSSEAWTKGISDIGSGEKISTELFLSNFNWINSWLSLHFKYILKILFPYISICLLVVFTLHYGSKRKIISKDKKTIIYFLVLLICSIIWFYKSPMFRYGYSFIISVISFALAYISLNITINSKRQKNVLIFIVILSLSTLLIKNIYRITYTKNNYNNYPWPKYYSMDNNNLHGKFKKEKLNSLEIFIPINGYCMYTKKICSHYEIDKNLRVKIQNKYIFFKN